MSIDPRAPTPRATASQSKPTRGEESLPATSSPPPIDSQRPRNFLEAFLQLLMALLNPDFDAELGRVATPGDDARDRAAGVNPGRTSQDARAAAERATGAVRRYLDENAGASPVTHSSPVLGESRVTSGFGMREQPVVGGQRHHDGIDLARVTQDSASPAIGASARGIVEFAGEMRGYGNIVILRHPDGTTSRYGHLASVSVQPGQILAQGEELGVMGTTGRSTGIHLHYEQRDASGRAMNPVINGNLLAEGQRVTAGTAVARSRRQTEQAVGSSAAEPAPTIPASVRAVADDAARGAGQAGVRPDQRAKAARTEDELGQIRVSSAVAPVKSGQSARESSSPTMA